MKLLNVQKARSIWLLEVQDLNPTGFDLWPMTAAIQNRYNFGKAPSREQSRVNNEGGVQFADGSFVLADSRRIAISALSIYNDGFVADTRTDSFATDEFLEDVLHFCINTFSLTYDSQTRKKRGYLSELIVTTELPRQRWRQASIVCEYALRVYGRSDFVTVRGRGSPIFGGPRYPGKDQSIQY